MALPTPVAYWKFDEASGTTAADSSGNGHTATIVHGTFDTSSNKKFGASALANTDGGRGASFTSINLGTVHSAAYWINGWDGSNDGIAIGGGAENYFGYTDSNWLYYSTGTTNYARIAYGGLTGSHHVVITRSSSTVKFYKDGTQLGSNQTLAVSGATSLTVGSISGYDSGSFPLVATLDDVRLYDVELTSAQVSELYALDPTIVVSAESVTTFLSKPV